MEQKKEYYAFISYKREDKKEAKWLQHALEYYRLPNQLRQHDSKLPEYVRPIFRDMTDLEVGELSAQIHSALEQSHYLIVVCSPRTAASKWVNDEIEYFISLGKQDKIIPYIIEGIPHASNPEEECYPPALLRLSKDKELLGANINEVGKDSATIRIVSRMFNIRFDTLYQRYQREQKRRRWQITIAIILAFLFLSGITGWIWHQNLLIKDRENKMVINQARAVAEKANQLTDNGDLTSAMMICMEIMPDKIVNSNRPLVPELLSAFYCAFYKYLLEDKRSICHIPTIDFHNNDHIDFGIVPGNQYVWSCSDSNANINLFDIQSGKLIHSQLMGCCYNDNQFSSDGKYYVSIDENESRIILQDVSSGNIINKSKNLGDSRLWNLRFNSTNTEVFVEQSGVGIRCLTIPSLDETYLISDMPGYWYVNERLNLFADFDSYNVWVGCKDTGNVIYTINDNINTCCFSDSLFAVSFSGNSWVHIYDFQTGNNIKQYKCSTDIDYMRFSRDMRYLAIINREEYKLEVYDLKYNLQKSIILPFDMWDYSIDCSQDNLVFFSDTDNNAYKYIFTTNKLAHCDYFEVLPDMSYRTIRDGIQPTIKVFRQKPRCQIKITKTSNYPYLNEGEGYYMIANDESKEHFDRVCEISDSISLFVPSDSSSLVLYNINKKCKNILRKNVQNNYNIPVNILNKECFAVFTKDSLLFFDKLSLNIQRGTKIQTSETRPNDIYAYKSSPNGEYFVRPENNDYCIYNTRGEVITTIDGEMYDNIDFSPSGRYLTCRKQSSNNSKLCILCTQTGQLVYEFEEPISSIHVSFDEKEKIFAFLYGRDCVAVIDIEQKRLINTFKPHIKGLDDIVLSPSGKYLLTTCHYEGSTKLWDVETGSYLFNFDFDNIYSVGFSEDNSTLILSNCQGDIEKFEEYAHSEIITKYIPFYSLEESILKVKEILRDRRVNSDERKIYYLE